MLQTVVRTHRLAIRLVAFSWRTSKIYNEYQTKATRVLARVLARVPIRVLARVHILPALLSAFIASLLGYKTKCTPYSLMNS